MRSTSSVINVVSFLPVLAILFAAAPARSITIATVPVGDVGNRSDPRTLIGSVNYAYNVGKYEVTVGQYTSFLNAVAATDTYNLYDPNMGTDQNVAGIERAGASGSYMYSVLGSANHPVTYVSWGDAVRFANWLHNGQPTGVQGPGTTETGAYTLNGATSNSALMAVTRKAGATWFIPTEAEWYKAAYYQPAAKGGDSDSYWTYPTKTNSIPFSDQSPGATPDNTRVANFNKDDGIANGYDDGYAVTGSTLYTSSQNYLTDVGAYTSSPSYYGTFDQAGNALEWNETAGNIGARILRGGSFRDSDRDYNALQSFVYTTWIAGPIPFQNLLALQDFGFRVASIPAAAGDFDTNG